MIEQPKTMGKKRNLGNICDLFESNVTFGDKRGASYQRSAPTSLDIEEFFWLDEGSFFCNQKVGDKRPEEVHPGDENREIEEDGVVLRDGKRRKIDRQNEGNGKDKDDSHRVEIIGSHRSLELLVYHSKERQPGRKGSRRGTVQQEHSEKLMIVIEAGGVPGEKE